MKQRSANCGKKFYFCTCFLVEILWKQDKVLLIKAHKNVFITHCHYTLKTNRLEIKLNCCLLKLVNSIVSKQNFYKYFLSTVSLLNVFFLSNFILFTVEKQFVLIPSNNVCKTFFHSQRESGGDGELREVPG